MRSFAVTIGVLGFVLVACPKEQAKEPAKAEPAKTEPAKMEPAKTEAAMAGNRKMEHCPSSVAGATTKIEDAADAVVVTITAADEAAAKSIRDDAKHLVEVSVKNPTELKHTGEGEGGGGLGNCPVVLADTTVTAEDIPGGAKVTVKPSKPEDLAKLKQLANERLSKLAAPK